MISALTLFGAVGCGSPASLDGAPADAYRGEAPVMGSELGSTAADGDYACPAGANIVPGYDRELDGTRDFTVCPSRTDYYRVLLKGIESARRVCVFPVQFVSTTDVRLFRKSDGSLVSYCTALETGQASLQYPALSNFNAAYIVDEADAPAMNTCLSSGLRYESCPRDFAYGKFR